MLGVGHPFGTPNLGIEVPGLHVPLNQWLLIFKVRL